VAADVIELSSGVLIPEARWLSQGWRRTGSSAPGMQPAELLMQDP